MEAIKDEMGGTAQVGAIVGGAAGGGPTYVRTTSSSRFGVVVVMLLSNSGSLSLKLANVGHIKSDIAPALAYDVLSLKG